MMEQAQLVEMKNDREITKESDSRFIFEYQRAILMTLKDKGILSKLQCQYAEEKLIEQLKQFQ